MKKEIGHRWNFFKAGGAYQAAINTADDIKNLGKLDKKLWSALACPTSGLMFDSKLLSMLDADADGRLRYGDIVSAAEWTCDSLSDVSRLFEESDTLELSQINTETSEGKTLLSSAKTVLANLGKAGDGKISVSDFADTAKIFAAGAFNADGIITELSCDDVLKPVFADILSVSTPKTDRSGKDGIDAADVEKFFADAAAYTAWLDAFNADSAVSPLGESTADAFAAYSAVKEKIDDFFVRVDVLRFAPDASASVNATAARFAEILSEEVGPCDASLKNLPAALVSADGMLDLSGDVNPAWRAPLAAFAELVAKPVCASTKISKADWKKIADTFAPYAAWRAAKPATDAEKIGGARLREILAGDAKTRFADAFVSEASVAAEVAEIEKVEKLVRLNKSLCPLLRNFVSFQSFYKDKAEAIFQFGQLYIDGRMCSLCIKVEDVAKHSAMASLSYGYLLYCVCKRKGEADMNIVAVVTAGDSDDLIVGKNGIFYDRAGRDWDATVVKIVDNPIGIAQAFFSPYKRLVKWVSEQIAKRALDADKSVAANLESGKIVDDKTKKIDIGTVAALGVAVGGITTAFGMILGAFVRLGPWMPIGIVGVILAISLPSVIIAAMKLGFRNLAPLLDANGWAVNNKANINIVFGAHLTQTPRRRRQGGA